MLYIQSCEQYFHSKKNGYNLNIEKQENVHTTIK